MYNLSGFINMSSLVNNSPGVDSPLGELSSKSKTFSRELGEYRNNLYPNVKLTSFDSRQDDVEIAVAPSYRDKILEISEWIYNKSISNVLTDSSETCEALLVQQFGSDVEFMNVGRMETNGIYYAPGMITFKILGVGEENVIRLWFSDVAFNAQYDLYEIVVIPPVEPLDQLHGNRADVISLLRSINIPDHLEQVDQLKESDPYTYLKSLSYDWVDPNDRTIREPTPWTVAIYGNAGNSLDIIRQALVDYILANSSFIREDWEVIYPDLFLPNEFYISPIWDKYSIPNMELQAGIYSPTAELPVQMSYAMSTFHNIPLEHVDQYMTHSTSVYKSIGFVAIGNPKNISEIYSFYDLWPNYAHISNKTDVNRLDPDTLNFIRRITEMFIAAESYNEYSTLPSTMSVVERGGKEYIATMYGNFQYLVSIKSNEITTWERPPSQTEVPISRYKVEWVYGDEANDSKSIVGHLYKLNDDTNEYEAVPDTADNIEWNAVFRKPDGTLVETVQLTDGSGEEQLFLYPTVEILDGSSILATLVIDEGNGNFDVAVSQHMVYLNTVAPTP